MAITMQEKTPRKNIILQLTFGGEMLFPYFETRMNLYLPLQEHAPISNHNLGTVRYNGVNTIIRIDNFRLVETAMPGFDIEFGGSLPKMDKLSAFVAYYYFAKHDLPTINGIRVHSNLELIDWLSVNAETNFNLSKDDIFQAPNSAHKGNVYYLGATIKHQFGKKHLKQNTKNILHKKMTLMPVRDVDIVTTKTLEHELVSQLIEGGRIPVVLPNPVPNLVFGVHHLPGTIQRHIYQKGYDYLLPNLYQHQADMVVNNIRVLNNQGHRQWRGMNHRYYNIATIIGNQIKTCRLYSPHTMTAATARAIGIQHLNPDRVIPHSTLYYAAVGFRANGALLQLGNRIRNHERIEAERIQREQAHAARRQPAPARQPARRQPAAPRGNELFRWRRGAAAPAAPAVVNPPVPAHIQQQMNNNNNNYANVFIMTVNQSLDRLA